MVIYFAIFVPSWGELPCVPRHTFGGDEYVSHLDLLDILLLLFFFSNLEVFCELAGSLVTSLCAIFLQLSGESK